MIDPQFKAIDLICDIVEQSKGAAKIVTLDEIAAHYKSQHQAHKP